MEIMKKIIKYYFFIKMFYINFSLWCMESGMYNKKKFLYIWIWVRGKDFLNYIFCNGLIDKFYVDNKLFFDFE